MGEKKMGKHKVCILTSVHQATDVRIFHKQAKSLAKAGYDVVLIGQHDKDETIDDVKIIALSKPKSRLMRFLSTLRVLRLGLRQKAHLYHFHDPELIPAGLVLKLYGKKVIYDVHEDYRSNILCNGWIPKLLAKPVALIADFSEKLLSRYFDAVVVVDIFLKRRFTKGSVKISNFPPVHLSGESKRRKEGVLRCVYAGGLSELRGIIKVVEALEHVSVPVQLLLLGHFENNRTREVVESLKGFDKVKYMGFVPSQEVATYLASSDVGMLILQPVPAYKPVGEGCLKLFEYMLMGLPVIASDFPFLRQILEENQCGILVDPTDPKKIAEAIDYLSRHRDTARKMGKNGRNAVLKKYNWESQEKKLLQLYERLLGGRKRKYCS